MSAEEPEEITLQDRLSGLRAASRTWRAPRRVTAAELFGSRTGPSPGGTDWGEDTSAEALPGMNGFFTVLGGFLSLVSAFFLGFRMTLLIALGIYCVALLAYVMISKSRTGLAQA